jgi:DMSO/TMAO reductase YedYZ heme-binding membrane subunit
VSKRSVRAVRAAVYLSAVALAIGVYRVPDPAADPQLSISLIETQLFALLASASLYLALLPGPLYEALPRLPGRDAFVAARRAFGVSALALSIPHAYHGFYGFLGGFEALRYWGTDYSISLLLGLIAIVLLVPAALTSFDAAAKRLGRGWKRLQRLVYLAGVLALAHSVTVTIHVANLWPWLAGTYVALVVLLLVESLEIDRARRNVRSGSWPVATSVGLPLGAGVLYWSFFLISHHRH